LYNCLRYIRDLKIYQIASGGGVFASDIEAAEDYDQGVTIAQHAQGIYRMMPGGLAQQVAALLAPQLAQQALAQQNALEQGLQGIQQELQGLRMLIASKASQQNKRAYNLICTQVVPLEPLPRDDGTLPAPPVVFPATKAAFYTLTAADCNRLVNFYGIMPGGTLDAKRARIGEFIGVV